MGYAVLRIEKIKTSTSFINRYNHDFRINDVKNADASKSVENKILIENPYGTYDNAYKEIVASSPIYQVAGPPRKDAVKGIDITLTYSHESIGLIDMNEWEKESVKWLQKTFGKDNVVSVVEHNDEGTPHIHAMVIPMYKGRLNASSIIGSPQKMSELQSSYATAMEPLGLERGLKFSRAEHEVLKAFYAGANKAISAELPEILPGETISQYRERANAIHKEVSMQAFYHQKQAQKAENKKDTISLNERLDFEEEKRLAKEQHSEAIELYERVLDIQRDNPGFPAIGVINAVSNAKNYISEYPDKQENVATMFETLGDIMKWEEEEKKKKQKREKDKGLERTI